MLQENSKYYDVYYNYTLGDKLILSDELEKVFQIIGDLSDRRGLRQEWEEIDGDIQDEIMETWLKIIKGE